MVDGRFSRYRRPYRESLSEKGTEKEIKKLLDIPDNFIIGFTMRLGYPVTPVNYLRVRRD